MKIQLYHGFYSQYTHKKNVVDLRDQYGNSPNWWERSDLIFGNKTGFSYLGSYARFYSYGKEENENTTISWILKEFAEGFVYGNGK